MAPYKVECKRLQETKNHSQEVFLSCGVWKMTKVIESDWKGREKWKEKSENWMKQNVRGFPDPRDRHVIA